MALIKNLSVFQRLHNFHLWTRCSHIYLPYFQKCSYSTLREDDEPIIYSKTKASKLKTTEIFNKPPNPAVLPIERWVVVLSITVFLIYLALRPENYLDEVIGGTFRYEEDDEVKLANAFVQARLRGLKTEDIENKLKEIRARKN